MDTETELYILQLLNGGSRWGDSTMNRSIARMLCFLRHNLRLRNKHLRIVKEQDIVFMSYLIGHDEIVPLIILI